MLKRLLLIGGAVCLVVGLLLMVLNGREARHQAGQIKAADASGQSTDEAVAKLKKYSLDHMGANTSVTLAGAFARAQTKAQSDAQAASNLNTQLYAQAQSACAGHTDSITQAKCVQSYVSARLVSAPTPSPVASPNPADYQLTFRSPLWTADAAGLGLLAGVVLLLGWLFTRGRKGHYGF